MTHVMAVELYEPDLADLLDLPATRTMRSDNGAVMLLMVAPAPIADCMMIVDRGETVGMIHGTDCGMSTPEGETVRCERREAGGSFRAVELASLPRRPVPVA